MNERSIFLAVLEIDDPSQRSAYLDQACAGDPALRKQVEQLLQAHQQPGPFMDRPAPALLPSPLGGEGQGEGGIATLDEPVVTERPGTVIGPYKLLQEIGEGGFGTVFMAEQEHPVRRKVALKVIKAGMDSRQVIIRFEAERQALAMMDHVNIARVLDAGATESGRPYFVMELVHGVPITKYCDDNHLTPRERLELFVPVCQAIQHAHQKGIIHRDIKPSNVMITLYDGKPVPKVIDFGVAKATEQKLTERTLFTQYGTMVGTFESMSPEQAEMSALGVDTRSDIYSLGVLLYELLTGSTPLSHKRLKEAAYGEILRMIKEEEAPKPSTRLSASGETLASISAQRRMEPAKLTKLMRGELDWIVMKCLEKDRNRRYETASTLAADVQRYLHDEPVLACPPSAMYRFRKLARRSKAPLMTAALLALTLLLGSVISIWQAVRARQAERLAEARLVTETEARQGAVIEAAKATAISALLQEALQSANPDQIKGADYTVRRLLDDLSQRLGDQLNDQPQAKAAIHATIGNAYRRLGLPQDAEPHLQKALELRRRFLGPDHPDVAQSLLDHSFNAFEKGNSVAAEAEARQALAICQKENVKHEKTLSAFGLLVFFLVEQRKAVEAQAVADQALAFARDAGYAEHPEVAKILHDLVPLRIRAGDLAGAEQLAIKAVAMHRRVNGNDHPETGWALLNRGNTFAAQGKHAEAETSFREALTIFHKHYEESHKSILLTSEALQRVLTNKDDKAGLAALRADKVARLSKALELQEGNLRIHLGNVLGDAGDLDRALAQFSEVITRDPKRVDAWIARGDCYVRRGEFAEAAEDYSAAIKLKPDTWDAWAGRAFFHFNRQQWDRAISDYSKAIDLDPQGLGLLQRDFQFIPDYSKAIDPPVRTLWWYRGHAYLQLAQWDKAAADFGKVVDQWPDGSEGWYWRGVAFAQLNQPDKAIASIRQAIAKGFNNVEHMKNNPTLAPLRSREDFGKLLEELERKEKSQSKQSGR